MLYRTFKSLIPQILTTAILQLVESQYKFYDIVGLFQKFNIGIVEAGEHPGGDLRPAFNQLRDHLFHHWKCLCH